VHADPLLGLKAPKLDARSSGRWRPSGSGPWWPPARAGSYATAATTKSLDDERPQLGTVQWQVSLFFGLNRGKGISFGAHRTTSTKAAPNYSSNFRHGLLASTRCLPPDGRHARGIVNDGPTSTP
jgi:hypothetical protein